MADGGTREDAILLNEHPNGPHLISLCFLCFLLFKSSLFSSVGLRSEPGFGGGAKLHASEIVISKPKPVERHARRRDFGIAEFSATWI
jgi:hypothetical protein